MRLVTAHLIAVLLVSPLAAQEPTEEERTHTVQRGETLWDLAARYLGDPYQWRSIYQANDQLLDSPSSLEPSQVLVIPTQPRVPGPESAESAPAAEPEPAAVPESGAVREPAAGAPREDPAGAPAPEARSAAESDAVESDAAAGRVGEAGRAAARRAPVGRTVFARAPAPRPQQEPTVLSEPGVDLVPVSDGEFVTAPYVMDPAALEVVGRFLRTARGGRGIPTTAHPQDRVFLGYEGSVRPRPGDRLALVRVRGSVGGERIIEPTGVVRIHGLLEEMMEGQIEEQYGPIYPDQLLIPLERAPDLRGVVAEPVQGGYDLDGEILAFADEQPLYGMRALAFLDRGRRDGVKVGDLFQAYLPERTVRERQPGEYRAETESLPSEVVAELRVVRVTDGYATARVHRLIQPLLDEGVPVRRVRVMP